MSKVGRGADQIMLRVPDGMREKIKALAGQSGRSMTNEIITAIENHLAANGIAVPSGPASYNARLDTFVAAALSGMVARDAKPINFKHAIEIGKAMLAAMEADNGES